MERGPTRAPRTVAPPPERRAIALDTLADARADAMMLALMYPLRSRETSRWGHVSMYLYK
eukprot:739908-Prorocentrum_minimum.AAC.3